MTAENHKVYTQDYREFLQEIPEGSVDLMLTDPPYAISKPTGFKGLGPNSVERFAVDMDFGEWDHQEIDLESLCSLSYRSLRKGGTAIIWYDLWKITPLAEAMKTAGFRQIRLIEWLKSNPVPLNSKVNYLTNSREIAVLGVKVGKPTFNSEYDNGQYIYPIPNKSKRFHPTQKPLDMFEKLVEKHSNKGDMIIDPFLGSGTTGVAATRLGRRFAGCDKDSEYVKIACRRINEVRQMA